MPSCSVPELVVVKSPKAIFVPSGDQPGSNALEKPPVASGTFARPVPSGWTTYSEPLAPNRIVVPSGDQLPQKQKLAKPQGVIRCSPLPSTLTTKSATLVLAGLAG